MTEPIRVRRPAPDSGGAATAPADAGPANVSAAKLWLASIGLGALELEPLVGDVSSRSYFRARTRGAGPTLVLARYPKELGAAQRRFRGAAELLAEAGVRVPRLVADDPDAGFALIEDLGPRTLYELGRGWNELARELDAALAAGAAIAALDPARVEALGCESLGEPLLRRELEQTIEWFLSPRGLATPELLAAMDELCARLASSPLAPCHRDFMARNLIPIEPDGVAVIDFQDLRLGPPGYDLASLLNDSLFAEPALERRVIDARADAIGGWPSYRRAVAQRSLKAVGTYVKFASTGRTRHLRLVPATLGRALDAMAELPESAGTIARLRGALEAAAAAIAAGTAGPRAGC